jgi:hypothetical protein
MAPTFRLVRAALCASVLVLGNGASQRGHAENPGSPDDLYLNGLQGDWDMIGRVRGRPVRYHAQGERVLQGGFLRLHMIDADTPPKYEADVFIGFDAKAGDYVAHWLDRFGAAGARVVATGKRDGQRLAISFPYAEGAFRDTFTFDPKAGAWSLLLESQEPDGAWSTFASYTLARPAIDSKPRRDDR